MARLLPLQPLTRKGFVPFGDVLDTSGPNSFPTNGGDALRFHELGIADCQADNGRTLLSIFRILKVAAPSPLQLMERHPISSQAFMPLDRMRMIVVVAEASVLPDATSLRAFISDGRQGVNFRRGTWHHPLIALDPGDVFVVDRDGSGPGFTQDYDEIDIAGLGLSLAPTPQDFTPTQNPYSGAST